MGEYIEFEGRYFGSLKLNRDFKFVFVAMSPSHLKELMRLPPESIVSVGGLDMLYRTFEKEYLNGVRSFYPSIEDYLKA